MIIPSQRGFTLIEVMISMFIFAVVLAGMGPAFISQLKQNSDAEIRTSAIQAAQIAFDDIRLQDITGLPMSGDAPMQVITVDGRTYDVLVRYCLNPTDCTLTSTRHLTVEVRYRGQLKFSTETVFTQLR